MKRTVFLLALLATIAVFNQATVLFGDVIIQEVSVQIIGDGPVDGSEAKLIRMDDRVRFKIKTSELLGGTYTCWFAVFNDPSGCAGTPCTSADLSTAEGASFWSTGKIISHHGKGTFTANIQAGTLPTGEDQIFADYTDGLGLVNIESSEIHVVIRHHGDPLPGQIREQLTTFNGGCNPTCQNLQMAQFLSPEAAAAPPAAQPIGKLALTWGNLKKSR